MKNLQGRHRLTAEYASDRRLAVFHEVFRQIRLRGPPFGSRFEPKGMFARCVTAAPNGVCASLTHTLGLTDSTVSFAILGPPVIHPCQASSNIQHTLSFRYAMTF